MLPSGRQPSALGVHRGGGKAQPLPSPRARAHEHTAPETEDLGTPNPAYEHVPMLRLQPQGSYRGGWPTTAGPTAPSLNPRPKPGRCNNRLRIVRQAVNPHASAPQRLQTANHLRRRPTGARVMRTTGDRLACKRAQAGGGGEGGAEPCADTCAPTMPNGLRAALSAETSTSATLSCARTTQPRYCGLPGGNRRRRNPPERCLPNRRRPHHPGQKARSAATAPTAPLARPTGTTPASRHPGRQQTPPPPPRNHVVAVGDGEPENCTANRNREKGWHAGTRPNDRTPPGPFAPGNRLRNAAQERVQ